jgi:hypothetical protein
MPAVAGGALWLSGGRPPGGGTALRRWVGATDMGLALEISSRFDDVREQLAVLEKILCGRLAPEYLLWNGRTK